MKILSIFLAVVASAPLFAQQKVAPVKLDGFIRMANKERLEVGDVAPIRVKIMHTGGTTGKSPAKVTVVITAPNGSTLNQGSKDVQVPFNDYAETSFDFLFPSAGKYTAVATATGENGSKWTESFSFTTYAKVVSKSKGPAGPTLETGTYESKVDIRMPDGTIVSHTVSLSLSKGPQTSMHIKGWMAPVKGTGYHFQFSGTWDGVSRTLSPSGSGTDASDRKCDVSLSLSQRSNNSLVGDVTISSKSTPVIINHVVLGKK